MMHRVLHNWPVALLGVHIGLSVVVNLDGLQQILTGRMHEAEGRWAATIQENPVLGPYAHYTGLLSGYGFYAPRVGSSCYLELGFADTSIHTLDVATLFRPAGYIRFRSFQHVFYELLPASGVDSPARRTRRRIAQATAIAIGQRVARHLDSELTFCRVFVYDQPTLRESRGNGQLIQLYALYLKE